ncbi:hypothetical protein ONS96_003732 [Cadophora gregata f. sp. sojae]|nr:hypothetical protein ONS96_003732 [Cadophora gregata f. sp. sojae]
MTGMMQIPRTELFLAESVGTTGLLVLGRLIIRSDMNSDLSHFTNPLSPQSHKSQISQSHTLNKGYAMGAVSESSRVESSLSGLLCLQAPVPRREREREIFFFSFSNAPDY